MTEEAVATVETNEESASAKEAARPADRCIFQGADGKCEKLNNTECKEGGCSFLVLPGEEARKQEIWAKRLCGLDEAKQKEISKKYYGGGRPWRLNK